MSNAYEKLMADVKKLDYVYTENEIAQELFAIMCDFFIGLYEVKDNVINVKFHSGQIYNITVTECK